MWFACDEHASKTSMDHRQSNFERRITQNCGNVQFLKLAFPFCIAFGCESIIGCRLRSQIDMRIMVDSKYLQIFG